MLDTLKQWLRIGTPQPPGDSATLLHTYTSPDGGLTVTVRSVDLDRMDTVLPCWAYETNGLMAFGQKELLLILKREPGEAELAFPRDPFPFFTGVLQFARDGRIVDTGDISWFSKDAKSFCGSYFLLYSFLPDHQKLSIPVQNPGDRLLCHLLHEDEGEAVKAWGGNRVLSQLGKAALYYPFPDWNDRNREALSIREDIPQSLLTKMPQLRLSQVTTYLEGNLDQKNALVTLRVPVSAVISLRSALEKLPQLPSIAIVTGWESSATGCFVWRVAQKETWAIAPPGGGDARVSGNFLMLSVEDKDMIRFHEDGYVVILTPLSFQRVLQSVRDATDLTLTAEGNRFSIYFSD